MKMIDETWWPDLLRYIADEDPWWGPNVVAAEVKSYDDPWTPGSRALWSALVPLDVLDQIEGNLVGFYHEPESSGLHPMERTTSTYRPKFWIVYRSETFDRILCEPLVVGWRSNNQTVMALNHGFTMTYGLVPRALAGGKTCWDDVETPEPNIAVFDPPSIYRDLRSTEARVVVSRDHLQDYLSLRKMALVQIYY